MGIYGLLSANGLSEYVTGKDMFGNELTDQQRQASLTQNIFAGLPFVPDMAKEANRLGQQALNSTVQIGKQGADVSRAFMDDLGRSLNTSPNAAFAGGVGNMSSYLKAESRADVGKVSGDKSEYLNMLSGRGSGVVDKGTSNVGSGSSKSDNISKVIQKLDKEIERFKNEGNAKEVKSLTRERNKLANKLDTKDDISDRYGLKAAKEYERKIDNTKYFSHDKGDFGEEATKIVARDNNLGQDISEMFQVGRNGIDAAFLSEGPPPKLTIIESKASDSASFSYSDKQKKGGDKYFQAMINSDDPRYASFGDNLEELMEEYPDLQFDFIRVETDIKITDTGFGVDELKVKDWNKEID